MKVYSIAVLAALSLALVGATSAAASESVTTTTVHVKGTDFKFALSPKTVKHGRIKFVFKNDSPALHDFAIAGHKTKVIGPGKTASFTVTLKRGRYPYKCTVDSHAELGMKGVLRVT